MEAMEGLGNAMAVVHAYYKEGGIFRIDLVSVPAPLLSLSTWRVAGPSPPTLGDPAVSIRPSPACSDSCRRSGEGRPSPQAGISPATAYRRLADPAFGQRLQQLRGDMVSRTAGTLTAAASESVRTLLELVESPTSSAVRLGAARAVLEIGMKLREMFDLEERLSALEQQMGATAS